MGRSVYLFGGGQADGDASMKAQLGMKGASLAELSRIGLPAPAGFTISTEAMLRNACQEGLSCDLKDQVLVALSKVESLTERQLGAPSRPLLVSVRCGAQGPMPGLMETVLNLGMNDAVAAALATETGSDWFALDTYRRFIAMYADAVLDVHRDRFEHELDRMRMTVARRNRIDALDTTPQERKRLVPDSLFTLSDSKRLTAAYKTIVLRKSGTPFPEDAREQLFGAIAVAFSSWSSHRAQSYRRLHGIPESWGLACSVQAMVFGHLGSDSAAGIAVSRDPATGVKAFLGRWLPNAQGPDLASEADRALPIAVGAEGLAGESLETRMPEAFRTLSEIKDRLENHYRDAQEIHFTIQRGELFILRSRIAKRAPRAAIRTAVDLVHEGILSRRDAVLRIDAGSIDHLLHPTLDPSAEKRFLARGRPASPGAASGVVVFSADEAVRQAEAGKSVIFVREETSPEDVYGMKVAHGVLTARGGMTSHAAVVARGMGKCCIVGCASISVDYAEQRFTASVQDEAGRTLANVDIRAGESITLDGSTGNVYWGAVPTLRASLSGDFGELMTWADDFRTMRVRANADIPEDARAARAFGAEGIGLCRTEHMFFEKERLPTMVEMIMAKDQSAREEALAKLLPYQRDDFVGLFREMKGLPVTIRLLDPPLHEFVPRGGAAADAMAKHLGIPADHVQRRAAELHEFNPMLGHRGCRLAITYPEIYRMQVSAILRAAIQVKAEGIDVIPEIMIPLVATRAELDRMKQLVDATASKVFAETGAKVDYLFGTMIELPRATLIADDLARGADFFSFGTNDLTQTVLGISRDDAGRFLAAYVDQGVLPVDPFQSVDTCGVGVLVKLGVEKGREARKDIHIGVCGEHGGDPASIHFFQSLGLEYISCSPYRVPVARLAAAQAALTQTPR